MNLNRVLEEMKGVARRSVALYFAPIVGAVRGIRAEYERLDREHGEERHMRLFSRRQSKAARSDVDRASE